MDRTWQPRKWLGWCVGVAAVALVAGCEEGPAVQPTEEPEPPAAEKARKAEPSAPRKAAGDPVNTPEEIVEEAHFELRLVEAGPYKAGELGQFMVNVTPRGEYHINEDFPYSVHVEPPKGIEVPQPSLKTEDAEVFNENEVKFAVPFTATQAGTHRIEAKVDFAVCTEENCIPEQRTLALNVAVE